MRRHRASVSELGEAVDHFVKVSRSYWGGLFACYDTAGLPRTNNDLERAFGSHRYHERRATGRKGASPALVLRGAVTEEAGRKVVTTGTIALAAAPEEALVTARGVFVAPRPDRQAAYFGAITDAAGRHAPPGRPTDGTRVR